jgi:hypothetical protein
MVSFTRAQMAHEDFSSVLIEYKYKVVDLASDAVSFGSLDLSSYAHVFYFEATYFLYS